MASLVFLGRDCGSKSITEVLDQGSNIIKKATREGDTDKSAVAKHVLDMSHNMDWSDTTVTYYDPQSLPKKVRESIHIRNSTEPCLINRDCGLEVSYMWDTLFVKTTSSMIP